MNKALLHKIHSLLLIAALAFGQIGAGFLHNKHDAHETVADPDHTVLVPHGEHCKVCSIDWVHQFIASHFFVGETITEFNSPAIVEKSLFISFSRPLTKDRAPPVAA